MVTLQLLELEAHGKLHLTFAEERAAGGVSHQVTGANSGIYTASTTAGSLTVPASGVLTPTLANGVSSFLVTNAAGGTLFRERQVQFAVRFQF